MVSVGQQPMHIRVYTTLLFYRTCPCISEWSSTSPHADTSLSWHTLYSLLDVEGCQFVYRKEHSTCTGDICKQNVWALYKDYISCIPYSVVCIHMCNGHDCDTRLDGYTADQCSYNIIIIP